MFLLLQAGAVIITMAAGVVDTAVAGEVMAGAMVDTVEVIHTDA